MAPLCLYRRVLGPRFELLPEVLRRFHDTAGGGRAHGTFRVERGAGWLRNSLASLWQMPPEAENVPVRLEVIVDGERERWLRHFAGHVLASTQWANEDLLMESFGSGVFSSALVIEDCCMRYEVRQVWLAGLPIPGFLSPEIDGRVHAGERGWRVATGFAVPILGTIIHYEGSVEIE